SPAALASWQQMVVGDKQELTLQPAPRISWMPPIHTSGSASNASTYLRSGAGSGTLTLSGLLPLNPSSPQARLNTSSVTIYTGATTQTTVTLGVNTTMPSSPGLFAPARFQSTRAGSGSVGTYG